MSLRYKKHIVGLATEICIPLGSAMYSCIYFNYFCSELIMKTVIHTCTQPPIRVAASDSKFASYFWRTDCLLFLGKNFLNQNKIELQHIHVLSLNLKSQNLIMSVFCSDTLIFVRGWWKCILRGLDVINFLGGMCLDPPSNLGLWHLQVATLSQVFFFFSAYYLLPPT